MMMMEIYDDEQDKEASEWMSEGGGGRQAPCLAKCQGFEPCMDDPMRAYCIPKNTLKTYFI